MANLHDTIPPATIVTGLPRSGTSLTMAMLGAGGMKLITDNLRPPDADNPRGYFEDERVKRLDKDSDWLWEVGDAAIKIISFQLPRLPDGFQCNVLHLMRPLEEILASQEKMVRRNGLHDTTSNSDLLPLYERHRAQISAWMDAKSAIRHQILQYHDVINTPHRAARAIADFLSRDLDIDSMVSVVDPKLYRHRLSPPSP